MTEDMSFTAGYILIAAGTTDVHTVRNRLQAVNGVRIAHALIGPDDLICFLDTYDPNEFRIALDQGVRKLIDEGLIDQTETLMILADSGHGYSGDENRPAPAAAWLFCEIGVGDPTPVVRRLLEIEGVINAHPVVGRYDIIAYVEAASTVELMHILDGDIRKIDELKRTDTRLVLMDVPKEKSHRDRTSQHPLGTQA